MSTSRLARLVLVSSSLLVGACAAGAEEPGTSSFGGPYGGPADDPYGGSGYEEDGDGDDGAMPPGGTSGGSGPVGDGDDTAGEEGNPLCCEVHPTAGCESATTEACVCTISPSCCQTVWTQECVDLAASCGDPFCEGEPPPDDSGGDPPPDDSGGDPPPDDSGGDPPPDDSGGDPPPATGCPCSADPAFDNFCSYAPGTADCPMTHPGGYCDPNGDANYDDGDWMQGYYDYQASC